MDALDLVPQRRPVAALRVLVYKIVEGALTNVIHHASAPEGRP